MILPILFRFGNGCATSGLPLFDLNQMTAFGHRAIDGGTARLDASFSLVCRELRKRGVPNPSAVDAGRFLDEAEGREPEGMPYFGEFYSDRIRLMHPENRFGVTPYPPAMNGDLAHLNLALREVYRLLLLGATVDPHNYIDFEDPDRAADTPTPDQF